MCGVISTVTFTTNYVPSWMLGDNCINLLVFVWTLVGVHSYNNALSYIHVLATGVFLPRVVIADRPDLRIMGDVVV